MFENNIILENNLQLELRNNYLHPSMKKYIRYTDKKMHCLSEQCILESLENAKKQIQNFDLIWLAMLRKKTYEMNLKFNKKINCTNNWVNGFFTNFNQVKKNLELYEKNKDKENFDSLRIKNKINKFYKLYGMMNFYQLPDLLFCSDTMYSIPARKEAIKKNIPIMALVDSQSDIQNIDYPIFVNTRNKKSVNFVILYLLDSFIEEKFDNKIEEVQEK